MSEIPKRLGVAFLIFLLIWFPFQTVHEEIIPPSESPEIKEKVERCINTLMDGQSDYSKAILEKQRDKLEILCSKYPDFSEVLLCMWEKESSYGKHLFGDFWNGKPRAIGHYQVWIDKHSIDYQCAIDFNCSTEFVYQMLKEGKGNLWTTYGKCVQ